MAPNNSMRKHILNDGEENEEEGEEENISIDEFLEHVGQLGPFQIVVLLFLSFTVMLAGIQAFLMLFANAEYKWRCSGLNENECNTTTIYTVTTKGYRSKCAMNRSSWKFVVKDTHSIVTEFDLVCSREALYHVTNSALFIGQIIFGFPMAFISDRYGRKRVLSFSFISLCFFSFVLSFSSNVWLLIVLRILSGGSFVGIMITVVVVSIELVGPKYRTLAGLVFWNAWSFGLCLLSLQSWLLPEWNVLSIISSAPYILFALGFLFIPESVRWYRSQNRTRDAEIILRRVAKFNKKVFPENKHLTPIGEGEATTASYRDLFSSWKEGLKTCVLSWMWFTNDLNYYGIAMASGDFGGSLHRDFVLFSLCEFPAVMFTIWVLNKVGRKKGTVMGYTVTSSSLICFGFLQYYNVELMALRVTLGMVAKIFNLISWGGTEIWSGELYSTVVRSQAIGLFFILSQAGSALSPWIALGLKHYSSSLPFFVFGSFPFIAGVLALTLKETCGKHINDGVEAEDTSKESIPIADMNPQVYPEV